MTSRKAFLFLCAVLVGLSVFLLGGCSPQQDESMAVEGVLLKLSGYTDGENEWALFTVPKNRQTPCCYSLCRKRSRQREAPLEEGRRVQVTCRSVQEIAPPILEEVSQVKVLGKASQEELETAQAKAAEYVENLGCPRRRALKRLCPNLWRTSSPLPHGATV